MKILDIGCGNRKFPGAIGVDKVKLPGVDVIYDLNQYPYPFKDNQFDLIIMNHIIEHISDVVRFLEEIYRVAAPNAIIKGLTPHFSSPYSFADPTHHHHFTFSTFYFFSKKSPRVSKLRRRLNNLLGCDSIPRQYYSKVNFEVIKIKILFRKFLRMLGVSTFANSFPEIYEFYLSGIFRARDIYFELKVIK